MRWRLLHYFPFYRYKNGTQRVKATCSRLRAKVMSQDSKSGLYHWQSLCSFQDPASTSSEHLFIKVKSHEMEKQLKPAKDKRKEKNADIQPVGQDLQKRSPFSHCRWRCWQAQNSWIACAPWSPTLGLENSNCASMCSHLDIRMPPHVWRVQATVHTVYPCHIPWNPSSSGTLLRKVTLWQVVLHTTRNRQSPQN